MLSFEEIEDCFPDGSFGDDAICVSAQWLHDFANSVAEKEREKCAELCDRVFAKRDLQGNMQAADAAEFCACEIRKRSNA